MTTPEERRRNLIWGLETLEEFSQDLSLAAPWRREAAELLKDYPPLELLRTVDGDCMFQLEGYGEVLIKSRSLFQRVRASVSCWPVRRYSLRVVLRHFW